MGRTKMTIQDTVYNNLRTNILNLDLKPGTAMSTQDIADKLGVSRTPVREAFIRLQRQGLVLAIPQKETMVSLIDLDRVEEERFIRESLELGAIERFLSRCSTSDFDFLSSQIEQQKLLRDQNDYIGFLRSDDELHHRLFHTAGQELAWDTLQNTNGHYVRIRLLTIRNADTINSSIEQHERILSLLRNGLIEEARSELVSHVRKINYEKVGLLQKYSEYFAAADTPDGSLSD